MDISQISGYLEIIDEIMDKYKIKENQRSKIDKLLRDALKEESMIHTNIQLLLDGGDYIYED